jgi:hypothetical protein
MTIKRNLVILTATSMLVGHVLAGPGRERVTVGQFATQVAKAFGEDTRNVATITVSLYADLDRNAPLTTGLAAQIARDLGVKIAAPANPSESMSAGQSASLAGYLVMAYAGQGATPSDPPTQCLVSENRGACVECCKEATGLSGQFCGRFCLANPPQGPSPEEPLP